MSTTVNQARVQKGAANLADNLLRDVSLPALVIHRAALEHNIRWMQDFVTRSGAVLGALTLVLAGSLLSFIRISPDWQIGAQGAILILVLALRTAVNRLEVRPA